MALSHFAACVCLVPLTGWRCEMMRRDFLGATTLGAAAAVLNGTSGSKAAPASTGPHLKLCWLGGATMLMTFDGFTLLTDPAFGTGDAAFEMIDPNEPWGEAGPVPKSHRRRTPFLGIDTAAVDQLVLSHLHEDHFDQAAEAALDRAVRIITPRGDLDRLAQKGFTRAEALDWGDEKTFSTGNGTITVTAVPADHSADPAVAATVGHGNGYWFEFRQDDWRLTLYWTGDTFATDRVRAAAGKRGHPDIMIPHVGAVGAAGPFGPLSMNAAQVVAMADQLGPGTLLPIHHSTFEIYVEPIWELARACEAKPYSLDLVAEGTWVMFS